MRKEILIITAIISLFSAVATQAAITDVFIFPQEPMVIDPITIITSGIEGSGDVVINSSSFLIDGTSLELDIFLDVGNFAIITPWSHSEDIDALLIGTYELTVNTIFESAPHLNDSYYTSFEVIPEPATILLFATGAIIFRTF